MRDFISANETIREDDHATVTAAVEAAIKDGCRTVKIPRYNARTRSTVWSFMKAIQIPSDFTLLLDNCFLEQGRGSYENLIINERIYEKGYPNDPKNRAHNIRIIGEGRAVLSGGVHNMSLEKTSYHYHNPGSMWFQSLMRFHNLEGLEVRNIQIQHQRYWSILHENVSNAVYRNIHLFCYPHVCTLDGIDMRAGCHHFSFENITGRSGDDTLACTGLMWEEPSFFTEGDSPDIHHIRVRNLKATSHNCFMMRLLNHDGAKEYEFDLDTFMDTSDRNSFRPSACLAIGSPFYAARETSKPGDTRDIRVKNLYTRATAALCLNHVLQDAEFSNVHTFDQNNILLQSYKDGSVMTGVRLDHLYYGSDQPEYPTGGRVRREDYKGTVIDLPNVSGDITVTHLESDPVRTGVRAGGGLSLDIRDFRAEETVEDYISDANSSITVDGEKVR